MRRRHGDEGELGEVRLRGASHVGGRARGRVGRNLRWRPALGAARSRSGVEIEGEVENDRGRPRGVCGLAASEAVNGGRVVAISNLVQYLMSVAAIMGPISNCV